MSAKRMGLKRSFAAFGADLRNHRQTSSDIAKDGALVISLWTVFFEPPFDTQHPPRHYKDSLKRWRNPVGREKTRKHLELAFKKDLPVRLVMAYTKDQDALLAGEVVTGNNTWLPHKDVVGKVRSLKGDNFTIEFKPIR